MQELTLKPLSLKMQLAMLSIVQHAFFNPEFAASLYVDPRDKFLLYNLTEANIEEFESYFTSVRTLIKDKYGLDDSHAKAPSEPEAILSLEPTTMQKLTPIVQKVLVDPDFAADVFAKPAEILGGSAFNLTEINHIMAYFHYVGYLIYKHIRSDWP